MKELTQNQCIEIRKTLLYEFHCMCQERDIKYSLGYGTLLGAVRHKGMIPWDDDIDVIVSREDFERLCEIYASNNCKDRYQFISHRNHSEIKTKIAYFIDYCTITETAHKMSDYHGVHIDIYPVDVLPNNEYKKKTILLRRWFLHKIIRAKDIHPEVMHGGGKLIRQMVLLLCSPFNYDKALDRLQDVSKKYMDMPESQKKQACILVETGKPLTFPYSITKEFQMYDYDDHKYWGFKNYDYILKMWYGDYMTPPPESERKMPGHAFVHFYSKEEY